jgi:hypothetical protein
MDARLPKKKAFMDARLKKAFMDARLKKSIYGCKAKKSPPLEFKIISRKKNLQSR